MARDDLPDIPSFAANRDEAVSQRASRCGAESGADRQPATRGQDGVSGGV